MPLMLIADDHKQITSVLEQYAVKEGYEVAVAGDGRQALAIFGLRHPDVVLLDVMMPLIDGFEVCREIRITASTPVIMITARGEDFERSWAWTIGADELHRQKPYRSGEVMARVRAIMRRVAPATGKEAVRPRLTSPSIWWITRLPSALSDRHADEEGK
jgi:DNA-binding response OmpR family regulator